MALKSTPNELDLSLSRGTSRTRYSAYRGLLVTQPSARCSRVRLDWYRNLCLTKRPPILSVSGGPVQRAVIQRCGSTVYDCPHELEASHVQRLPGPVVVSRQASTATCTKTFSKAKNFKELVDLVRAAEAKLAVAGITSVAPRPPPGSTIQPRTMDLHHQRSIRPGVRPYRGSVFTSVYSSRSSSRSGTRNTCCPAFEHVISIIE